MTGPATDARSDGPRHLTLMDERSLADEESAQTAESVPDTLEVRDDSRAILTGTMNSLRRPLAIAAVVGVIGVLVAVGIGALTRTRAAG